ncbi:MAG TPA: tRNA (adenosine(37)-N6)-dimethylallyltransferase MiaA [Opitutaceae bacterium]|jgi:tRNA dimethylallyltransferase|nr:tRNA (adenosine(37)-N6)-dimethylallyltransferase MiaA [Opitutaceae bacterium]
MTRKAIGDTIYVLTGPTAAGKTELALRWAEVRNAEIVSCDSLLFYRGMDIGTAKPSAGERARVPHHLIDVVEVTDPMDVTRYVAGAKAVIADIVARGRAVLVTGGSGFYLKAFFSPVADGVDVPGEVRRRVEKLSLAEALAELRQCNPNGIENVDTNNPRRVARALERCLASGRTLRELAGDFARQPAPFADRRVVLTRLERPAAELNTRIEARVAGMLRAGLVDEVRGLRAAGLEKNPSAARAIGYREVLARLDGKLDDTGLAAEIVKNTRALVKKQRTWFRTQLPAHHVTEASGAEVDRLFGG